MKKEFKIELMRLSLVFFFCIWMAYLESAVVVYLRELYYPEGFRFPIILIPKQIALVEVGREAATLFMLLAIAFLAGTGRWIRMAYFMFGFGVWDIWYYIWLKIFLNWPESLFTWDLLFLIPVPWASPVLAPVLVSIALITGAMLVLYVEKNGRRFSLTRWEMIGLILAPIIIFISFILDYSTIVSAGVPISYRWEMLIIGLLIGVTILLRSVKRLLRT
ncbi:MAG: hypothetical protein ACOY90_04435 [Candidatus Zhuqueibacterota bacterium]